jgi:hypothetical protein
MANLFLKPARDASGHPLVVRDPVSWKALDPAGEWKADAPYWRRRLRDGDVVAAPPAGEAPAPRRKAAKAAAPVES